jgi:OOP family OmpA-OmpF porin
MTAAGNNQHTMNPLRNKKMIRSTIRITAIAFLAQIFLMQVAVADGTWYVGASIGSTNLDNGVDGFQLDSDSTAKRFYGGYSFNEHFSVDGGYLDLGQFDTFVDSAGNPIQISEDADGFLFAATGSIPLSDKLSLYGRLGAFFWDGESLIGNVDDNVSDVNAHLAVGIRAIVYKNLSITADWSRFDLDGTTADLVAIGLQVGF